MKVIATVALFSGVLLLAGCTGTNTKFSCNAITPDRCLSLDETNRLANQGAFGGVDQKASFALPSPNKTERQQVFIHDSDSSDLVWIAPQSKRLSYQATFSLPSGLTNSKRDQVAWIALSVSQPDVGISTQAAFSEVA